MVLFNSFRSVQGWFRQSSVNDQYSKYEETLVRKRQYHWNLKRRSTMVLSWCRFSITSILNYEKKVFVENLYLSKVNKMILFPLCPKIYFPLQHKIRGNPKLYPSSVTQPNFHFTLGVGTQTHILTLWLRVTISPFKLVCRTIRNNQIRNNIISPHINRCVDVHNPS